MKVPLLNCSHGVCRRGRQHLGGYEQLVQEQPSRLVRSNFRHPTPHKDRTRLGVSLGGQAAHQGRGAADGSEFRQTAGVAETLVEGPVAHPACGDRVPASPPVARPHADRRRQAISLDRELVQLYCFPQGKRYKMA